MLQDHEKDRILKKFQEMERTPLSNGTTIEEIAQINVEKSETLRASIDPIAPVLRTALVINWREAAMKKRYESFRERFPNIDSLSALKSLINETPPLDFCNNYLDIKANPDKPEQNPKLALLKTLTNGFLGYQSSLNISSEIGAMRHWAEKVDLNDLRNDPIGKLKGVGPGTVENIRLNMGYCTVKPDRHVIGVAKKCLGISTSPLHYPRLASFIGINPRYFDSVLFEYGKLKGVSST